MGVNGKTCYEQGAVEEGEEEECFDDGWHRVSLRRCRVWQSAASA